MKPLLSRRHQLGSCAQICSELQVESESNFREYLKMSVPVFFVILEKIKPYIGKETPRVRDPVPPGARLEATTPCRWVVRNERRTSHSSSQLIFMSPMKQ